jgi:hypothetical protein
MVKPSPKKLVTYSIQHGISISQPPGIAGCCAHRERPRSYRATQQRNELAPFLIRLHPIPHDEWGPHRRIPNWQRSVQRVSE